MQQICAFLQFMSINCYVVTSRLYVVANLTPFTSKLIADSVLLLFYYHVETTKSLCVGLVEDPAHLFKSTISKNHCTLLQ